jgi:prepilin-type N-terminal cleavage/methylation domain-containing protein
MRTRQAGFTLVEIAIVLVIIGLLLGGVLKGQELINSAKVKNFAQDFRTVPLFIYGYQDKFRALPGDDGNPKAHLGNDAVPASTPANKTPNGAIDGEWFSTTGTDETALFWQHVRLANLAAGPTNTADSAYYPTNAEGGRIGIESASASNPYITNLKGTYVVCSRGILGKFVKQLDVNMDDGCPATGSMMAIPGAPTGRPNSAVFLQSAGICSGGTVIDDSQPYTVCMAF